MENGKALGGAHPETGGCEGSVGDQETFLEIGGAFPPTTPVPAVPAVVPFPAAPAGRGGRRAWRSWSGALAGGRETGNREHCCHLVGQACYFSWLPTPGSSSAEY